jgi:hypothetical protein
MRLSNTSKVEVNPDNFLLSPREANEFDLQNRWKSGRTFTP